MQQFLKSNAKDFIVFKTNLLIEEVKDDPVKKALLIRDVVESIAKIPDPIIRSTYTKQCSALLDIQEQILIAELNKIRRTQLKKQMDKEEAEAIPLDLLPVHQPLAEESAEYQEKDIVRLLLNYPNHDLHFYEEVQNEDSRREVKHTAIKLSCFIIRELEHDGIIIETPIYQRIFGEVFSLVKSSSVYNSIGSDFQLFDIKHFTNHTDSEIANLAISLTTSPYQLSENWIAMHKIDVPIEENTLLTKSVINSVLKIKIKSIMKLIKENRQKVKKEYENRRRY